MKRIAILGSKAFEGQRELEMFGPAGYEASYYTSDDPESIADRLTGIDGLLVNLDRITDDLLSRLPSLKVIGRYGVGVDNIDLESASKRGIAVINVPDYCIDEVAEHAVSFIFAANRKHKQAASMTLSGIWGSVQEIKPIHSIKNQTLGVVGTGRIGMRVIEMMAFGCRILIYDPYLSGAKLPDNAEIVGFDELLRASDIITVHCPLNEQTRHMFNADTFRKTGKKPAIVNVSRGPIIHEGDLLDALDDGIVSFAALDVLEKEPPATDHPLLHHPRALVTGHAAWYSEEAEQRLRDLVASRMVDYLEDRPVTSIANRAGLQNYIQSKEI